MPIRKSKYDILRLDDEPVDQFPVSYNRLTITTDDYGLLIQMRDAALMEDEQLLEFLCPFTKETDYAWEHDWCVENWGTKWDVFDVEIVSLVDDTLELTFSTAWLPPVEALNHGAERYGFDFFLTYKEEGMMFAGWATPLMDNHYRFTFDVPPHEEMPCQLVDEWGIDVDYDDYIMSAEDDELSDDQKEWRKMLREDMQKEYGNG